MFPDGFHVNGLEGMSFGEVSLQIHNCVFGVSFQRCVCVRVCVCVCVFWELIPCLGFFKLFCGRVKTNSDGCRSTSGKLP